MAGAALFILVCTVIGLLLYVFARGWAAVLDEDERDESNARVSGIELLAIMFFLPIGFAWAVIGGFLQLFFSKVDGGLKEDD